MWTFQTLQNYLFLVVMYWCLCCRISSNCIAQESELADLVLSFDEIRMGHPDEDGEYAAHADLIVSNRSRQTYCLLLSDYTFGYFLMYKNEEVGGGAGGSRTLASRKEDISDLDLDTLLVDPGQDVRLSVTVGSQRGGAKGESGRIHITYGCLPRANDDSYRGVLIYRHEMRTSSDFVIQKDLATGEWTIESVGSREFAGTPDDENGTGPILKEQRRVPARTPTVRRRSWRRPGTRYRFWKNR